MVYAIIFFGIAISIWKEGSWDKKAFLYDPTARFLMPICFVMGAFCLCGMYVGYDCVRNACDIHKAETKRESLTIMRGNNE
jgi:hypothetical protein